MGCYQPLTYLPTQNAADEIRMLLFIDSGIHTLSHLQCHSFSYQLLDPFFHLCLQSLRASFRERLETHTHGTRQQLFERVFLHRSISWDGCVLTAIWNKKEGLNLLVRGKFVFAPGLIRNFQACVIYCVLEHSFGWSNARCCVCFRLIRAPRQVWGFYSTRLMPSFSSVKKARGLTCPPKAGRNERSPHPVQQRD